MLKEEEEMIRMETEMIQPDKCKIENEYDATETYLKYDDDYSDALIESRNLNESFDDSSQAAVSS